MGTVVILLVILLAAIGAVLLFRRRRAAASESNDRGVNQYELAVSAEMPPAEQEQRITLPLEPVSAEVRIDESRLMEITDKRIIDRFIDLVPDAVLVLNNLQSAHLFDKAVETGGALYQAVIPKGAVLDKSRAMKDAVRGTFRQGAKIQGQANWVSADATVSKMAKANIVSSVFDLSSIVVGQYYMTQINAKLNIICDSISQIASYQNNEYESRVEALIAEIQKIATFQVEILENRELLRIELASLQDLERECGQLLGQANHMVEDIVEREELSYKEYEKRIEEINSWYRYQWVLLGVLYQIGDLSHTLHLGDVSKAYCHAQFERYLKQTEAVRQNLNCWHQKQFERLAVDVASHQRRRVGFEGALYKVPGLINDSLNYRAISEETAEMISEQLEADIASYAGSNVDLFQEDVRLIAKDGKLFYLPGTKVEGESAL